MSFFSISPHNVYGEIDNRIYGELDTDIYDDEVPCLIDGEAILAAYTNTAYDAWGSTELIDLGLEDYMYDDCDVYCYENDLW